MTSPARQRARSAEAKRQRERDILDAARSLAEARTIREVTLTDIAAEVGMHKSAMLRYFETREQIFLALSAEGWQEWSGVVRAGLAGESEPGEVAAVLAGTLTARPLFCDLLAHTPLNLERNVTLETAYGFKMTAVAEARRVAADLAAALGLEMPQAIDAVATATGMAGALWQMSSGTQLNELYQRYPDLAHSRVDVGPRLAAILTALFTGMQVTGMRAAPPPDKARRSRPTG